MGATDKNGVMQERVDGARTSAEVVRAVSEYVGSLTRQEMDRLPRFNRPGIIDDAEAVHRWAEQLSRYQPAANQDPLNDALFASMRDCFGQASRRITTLGSQR
jgi:hypothetical protein